MYNIPGQSQIFIHPKFINSIKVLVPDLALSKYLQIRGMAANITMNNRDFNFNTKNQIIIQNYTSHKIHAIFCTIIQMWNLVTFDMISTIYGPYHTLRWRLIMEDLNNLSPTIDLNFLIKSSRLISLLWMDTNKRKN